MKKIHWLDVIVTLIAIGLFFLSPGLPDELVLAAGYALIRTWLV